MKRNLSRLMGLWMAVASLSDAGAAGNNWMSSFSGSLYVSQLSIPGTHDSGALVEPLSGTAKCQNLSIGDQLNAGVRFLDIRCRHVNDAFAIHHGQVYQNMNFDDVLNAVFGFLNSNPTETVIMSVKEEYDPTGNTRSFEQTFDWYVAKNPNQWNLGSAIPSLSAARGKIVLLRRFGASNLPKGIDASNWGDNTTFSSGVLRVQDWYNVSNNDTKWGYINAILSEANAGSPGTLYVNFSSGVGSILGIPNIPMVANNINPRVTSFFTANTSGHFGIIPMDFADAAKCALIYNTVCAVVPQNLTVSSASANVLNLSWSASLGGMSYNVKRSTASGGPYLTVATVAGTSYADNAVVAGATYYYVVSALRASAESANSPQASCAVEPLSNFGFEMPSVANYQYNPTGGSWTFSTSSGIIANGSGFSNPSAPQGTQAAFVQYYGTISQRLTGLVPGGSYVVTFSAAQRPNNQHGGQSWDVKIDNSVVASYNPGPGAISYADYSVNFTATTTAHMLSFVGTDLATGDNTVFMDNVRITTIAAPTVSNFGFETPSVASYQYNPSGGSWTFSGSAGNGSGILANGSAFNNPPVPQGTQAAFIQAYGTMSQTLSGFIPGTTYAITFAAAQRSTVNTGGESWNVKIDNTVIGTYNPGAGATNFVDYTAAFTASAATHMLSFVGTDLASGDNTVFVDNVRISIILPIVSNSGFETPSVANYQYNPSGGDWTFSGAANSGSGILHNGSGFNNPASPQGTQAAFLQRYGTIAETLAGFVPGATYTVTFAAAQRPNQSGGESWNVKIDNTVIKTFNPGAGATGYADYTAAFIASAPTHTLTFVGTDLATGDNTVFLDNVRVAAALPLVPDLGFETLSVPDYQYNPLGGPWTFSGSNSNGSGIVANGSAFHNPNAPQGIQAAFIQAYGTISQTLSGFIPGTTYALTFAAAQRGSQNNGGESWNVKKDNTVIGSYNPGPSATSFVDYTATFTASAKTHTLSFVGTDLATGDNTVFIDNLRLAPLLQQVVPSTNDIPATLPLGLRKEGLGSPNLLLTGAGSVGQVAVLMTATNLISPVIWTPVFTNQVDTNGQVNFSNPSTTNSQMFYRLLTP